MIDAYVYVRRFWLRREVVEEQRLQLFSGQNLAEIEDIEYFKKKLYRSLNVPSSRLEQIMV